MQKRKIGRTGIEVSILGLGTVKFGRNQGVKYPEAFALPDDQSILKLLSVATELGINFIDTAPAYGLSEERLGKLLHDHRSQWVIATKAGEEFIDGQSQFDFSAMGLQKSIDRSLRRLQTDYLDIVLVHSSGEDERIINEDGVFETLARIKEQGKIRAFGMSSKTLAGGLLTIEQADLAMVTYYPGYTEEQAVIQHSKQNNKGILIKKAFQSGHLDKIAGNDPVAASLEFIFAEPGVTSVVVGTLNPEHLRANVRAAELAAKQ